MGNPLPRLPQGLALLAGVVLLAGCGRYGYDLLSEGEAGPSSDGTGALSGGAGGTSAADGTGGTQAGSGGVGSGGVDSSATSMGGSSATSMGGSMGGSGGVGSAGVGSGGVASGGVASGGVGGSSAMSMGGSGGVGTTSGGGVGGAGGSASNTLSTNTSTTSGGTAIPDLGDGYWVLNASDSGGQVWTPSALVFTSTSENPDGTISLSYRLDWFEDAGSFGMLLGGEEFGVGSFDPASNLLVFDQTGGWSASVLDHYEANYTLATDSLEGAWDTGNPGTFSAVRTLSGGLLAGLSVQVTSERNGFPANAIIDADMKSYWSSATNATIGEVITLSWGTPVGLTGLRLLAIPSGNDAIPARITVTSRDDQGGVVDVSDLSVPADAMWKPMPLVITTPVVSVELEVTETTPANGTRVVVSGLELFASP